MPDFVNTDKHTVLSLPAPGVLANDTDSDPQAQLHVSTFDAQSASGATVQVQPDGSFTYDPTTAPTLQALKLGQDVEDDFSYTVIDSNGQTAQGEVNVEVEGVSDAPDDVFSTAQSVVLVQAAPGLLANDSIPGASGPLTVVPFQGSSSSGATVSVNADGSFTYDPTQSIDLQFLPPGMVGLDTFTYTATDAAGDTITPTVTIQVTGVNSPPQPQDDSGATNADTLLTQPAPGVLANDIDPNGGDQISVTGFDAVSANGAVVSVAPDGSYTYDPRQAPILQALSMGEVKFDTFTYTVQDQHGASATARVTIAVTGVNQPPTVTSPSFDTDALTAILESGPGLLTGAADPNQDDQLTVIPVQIQSDSGATVDIGADGSFAYDPTASSSLQALGAGQTVVDHFSFQVSDGHGGTTTAQASVTVQGLAQQPTPGAITTENLVQGFYAGVLGRPADPAGLAFWTGQLDSGNPSGAVAASFWTSPEHRGIQVDGYYSRFLGRPADAAGRAAWVNALVSGQSEAQVVAAFLLSPEYLSEHAGDAVFVNGLYQGLLGRDAEPAAQAAIAQWLQQHTDFTNPTTIQTSRMDLLNTLVATVFDSHEHRLLVLDGFYNTFLDRPADPSGIQEFLPVLHLGGNDYTFVVASILSSSEFAQAD